jgi:hypothetical protein
VRRLTWRALLAVAVTTAAAPVAWAHLGHVVVRAERYLKIEATPEEARVVVSMSMGPGEMYNVLAAADADGDADGQVTPEEARAYLARWGEGLTEELPIELNGRRVEVTWGDGHLGPLGPVRAVPGIVEMVARVPLDGGQHTLVVRDRMRPEVADRTDVAFRVRDGAELIASGATAEPDRPIADLAYGPDLVAAGKADAITAVIEVPGLTRTQRLAGYGAAGLLVLLAAGSWIALRRGRAGSATADRDT